MKNFLFIFLNLGNHPLSMIKNDFTKLKKNKEDFSKTLQILINWELSGLNDSERQQQINRLWIDNKDKPKNWKIISSLLSITSTTHKLGNK